MVVVHNEGYTTKSLFRNGLSTDQICRLVLHSAKLRLHARPGRYNYIRNGYNDNRIHKDYNDNRIHKNTGYMCRILDKR
jgi:hypothetical protein